MGALDIGLLYSPRNLPELVIQQEGGEKFVMVSTHASIISDVPALSYIRTNYTTFFNRSHDELLPRLLTSPISVGNEELALELMMRIGGSSYLPSQQAHRLCNDHSQLEIVEDAPEISQPIYSVVHMRRCRQPSVVKVLETLRNILTDNRSDFNQ